jgi:hypothetical protein
MRLSTICAAALSVLFLAALIVAAPDDGVITGKVTFTGTPAKPEVIDMTKQPECAKLRTKLTTEKVVTGPGHALQHVVVYISGGESQIRETETVTARFDQQGCRYTTHVLALRVGQEVAISNSDPFNHNIHPLPKINREWNKIQLPGTPPFTYSYDKEEFIPVKCNIHSWMQAYFVVLRTSHFAVTENDGIFTLPTLPPGKYTVTAWHEAYGAQSQAVTVSGGQSTAVDFVFTAKP